MPQLYGDQRRLLQVLVNLAKNALQYTSRGSIKISVCFDEATDTLFVCVSDSGIGISQNQLPNLFK